MTDTELAWCAGLFEGEGSIFKVTMRKKGKEYHYVRMALKMTDLDIVQRFASLVRHGTVQYQTPMCQKLYPGRKRHYYWQLNNREHIKYLVGLFWQYFGERRRAKVLELELWDNAGTGIQNGLKIRRP